MFFVKYLIIYPKHLFNWNIKSMRGRFYSLEWLYAILDPVV